MHSRHSSRQLALERVTSASSRPDSAWVPSGGGKIDTNDAIVLENVTHGFKRPNVLDVKLGARLWADDAPKAKRDKLDKAAEETTSKVLGFRLAGMRTWHGDDPECKDKLTDDGYKVYDKSYGRSLTEKTIRRGFEEYFQLAPGEKAERGRLIRRVINKTLSELRELQEAIEHEESRMYSSSLLFIYEGDVEALQAGLKGEKALQEALIQATEASSPGIANDEALTDGDLTKSQVLTGIDPGVLRAISVANPSIAPPSGLDHVVKPDVVASNGITPLILNATDIDTDDDDDESSADDLFKAPKTTVLKLIDFAHAQWTPGQGPDENVLHGIRNVIKVLETLI